MMKLFRYISLLFSIAYNITSAISSSSSSLDLLRSKSQSSPPEMQMTPLTRLKSFNHNSNIPHPAHHFFIHIIDVTQDLIHSRPPISIKKLAELPLTCRILFLKVPH
jgi:hypothetical protein